MRDVDENVARNSRTLMRIMLNELENMTEASIEYDRMVHRIASLAGDAGLDMRLVIGETYDSSQQIYVFIELPQGEIIFPVTTHRSPMEWPTKEEQDQRIREFIYSVMDEEQQHVDPYNGHCRECYAFKGRWGGECVLPECPCHKKGE